MHYHAEVYLETLEGMEEQLQRILAPYEEYGCRNWTEEEEARYLAFDDEEDAYREKYKTGSVEMVIMPDGRKLFKWDKEFAVKNRSLSEPSTKIPEDLEIKKVPFEEAYESFEEFMKDRAGMEAPDEKTGRYGHWRNPKSFWDWWQIGGRWTGSHTGYDPYSDPVNTEKCWVCNGTGFRNDALGKAGREENPSYTCNGCGQYNSETKEWEHGAFGPGITLKWPTNFAFHTGDIISVSGLSEELNCFTLIIGTDDILPGGKVFHKEEWNSKDETFDKTNFDGNVKNKLDELGIKEGYLVTVDYHC